jgi:hypothetical protein
VLSQPASASASATTVSAPSANPELLRSLGRLARGLSALFWGLPLTLLACFHAARAEFIASFWAFPPSLCTGWLLYGLWQLGEFQRQERVWHNALERARILELINLGLSPFLYWHNRVPANGFFLAMLCLMCLTGLLFLAALNLVLQRLGAMLPDQTVQVETRQFTALNLNLLLSLLVLSLAYFGLKQVPLQMLPEWSHPVVFVIDRASIFMLIPLLLLPVAMTMALLWKTKQVILDSVFSARV